MNSYRFLESACDVDIILGRCTGGSLFDTNRQYVLWIPHWVFCRILLRYGLLTGVAAEGVAVCMGYVTIIIFCSSYLCYHRVFPVNILMWVWVMKQML